MIIPLSAGRLGAGCESAWKGSVLRKARFESSNVDGTVVQVAHPCTPFNFLHGHEKGHRRSKFGNWLKTELFQSEKRNSKAGQDKMSAKNLHQTYFSNLIILLAICSCKKVAKMINTIYKYPSLGGAVETQAEMHGRLFGLCSLCVQQLQTHAAPRL